MTLFGAVLGVVLTPLTEKYRQRPTLVLRGNYGAGGFSLLRIVLRHER